MNKNGRLTKLLFVAMYVVVIIIFGVLIVLRNTIGKKVTAQ